MAFDRDMGMADALYNIPEKISEKVGFKLVIIFIEILEKSGYNK